MLVHYELPAQGHRISWILSFAISLHECFVFLVAHVIVVLCFLRISNFPVLLVWGTDASNRCSLQFLCLSDLLY